MRFFNILVVVAVVVVIVSKAEPLPCEFPAVFNFGDSNSDTGGLSASFGPAPLPNGETYFGKPAGRYSDGRLIIDFIAESLGLPHLSAYLDSIGTNFTHGANFATAGSTIQRQNTTLFQSGFSPFSLDVQSWQFSQFKSRSLPIYIQGGVFKELLPKEEVFSKALYTFDIGQNDLTAPYFLNMSTEEVKAIIPELIHDFVVLVKSIHDQGGGRSFWIHNTGPFGCLPYIIDRFPAMAPQLDRPGCGISFNEVAQLYNYKLKEAVEKLRADFPSAAFTYVDVYSLKYELITHATKYGFDHPLVSCCGHGGKYNYNSHLGCGTKMTINGTVVFIGKSCDNPSKKIIWDGVHYTEMANKWVFDRIATGNFSNPPMPPNMACYNNNMAR